MEISVIGAGAIGALVAGYLRIKGIDVTLVARPKDVDIIGRNGLIVEGVRGRTAIPITAVEKLEGRSDLVILAVKTQDIAATLSQNHAALGGAFILSVQNGVRAEELLREAIPQEKVISSIVMFGATYLEPGKVVHNFDGDWIIGSAFARNDAEIETMGSILNNAFPVHVSDKIRGMKWLKLFLNLNNCLPALIGKSMQETFSNLEIAKIAMRLWREALEVVNGAGIKLESLPDFPVDRLIGLTSMPLDEAGKLYSSIMTGLSKEPLYGSVLQSIKRARPSEIDYINGEMARLGEKMGVSAALNNRAIAMVHQVEKTGEFLAEETVLTELGGENG